MKKFKIKDVGAPFDGLIAHVDTEKLTRSGIIPIDRVQQDHVLFNSFSMPLNEGTLWIKAECLEQYEKLVEDESPTGNILGKFVSEGLTRSGDIEITYAQYEQALTVRVTQGDNTLYVHNFMTTPRAALVRNFISTGLIAYDWDNLIFDLQELETVEIEVIGNGEKEERI